MATVGDPIPGQPLLDALISVPGVVVVCLDKNARITALSDSASQLHGVGPEAVGVDYCESFLPLEGASTMRARVMAIAAGAEMQCLENTIIDKSGANRLMSWSLCRVVDRSGVAGVVAVGWDSAARRCESQGQEARIARAAAIAEQTTELVLLCEPDTTQIVEVNMAACAGLGYTQGELLAMRLSDLVVDGSGRPAPHGRPPRSAVPAIRRGFLKRGDGSVIRVEATTSLREFPDRVLVLNVVRDMTRSAQLAEKLVEAERERRRAAAEAQLLKSGRLVSIGTLAAGVAHEINNPLAYVMGNLQFLLRDLERLCGDPAELRQILDETLYGAERIRVIMKDLGVFSRTDEGDHRSPIDVHEPLNSAVNLTHNEVSHRAQLFKDYSETPPVLANEGRMAQVFVNLLVNAAQAIPEGRSTQNEIRIRTGVELGMVYIEIKDTGQGIAKDALGRIFDPFYTTKDVGEGTGLGLSICEGLIREMDGDIQVESRVGRGTIVRVTVPLADSVRRSPYGLELPAEHSVKPARILLIDDEDAVARTLARLLHRHHVTIATSGREALECLQGSGPFELVLCDLMLPDVNGVEIYYRVRDEDPAMAARFVFMTGGAFTAATRAFVEETTNPVVQKPFDLPHIEGLIRSFSGE